MKKITIFLFVLTIIFFLTNNNQKVVIPKDSIRFRIIANSNAKEDQLLKWNITKKLVPNLDSILNTSSSLDESRNQIKRNLTNIEKVVKNNTDNYSINYGMNYFPEKTYNDVTYKEGNYESLVITLGDGLGDNFWCVLFPPLCLLEADKDNIDDITYTTYVKKTLNKFNNLTKNIK